MRPSWSCRGSATATRCKYANYGTTSSHGWMWSHARPWAAGRRALTFKPSDLPRNSQSPFAAAAYRADRGHAKRNTPHQSAREKWDERGEGANVCGERRVQSAAEPALQKQQLLHKLRKLLRANMSPSVKDAARFFSASAGNVIRGRVCQARTFGHHNYNCLPSYDDIMTSSWQTMRRWVFQHCGTLNSSLNIVPLIDQWKSSQVIIRYFKQVIRQKCLYY